MLRACCETCAAVEVQDSKQYLVAFEDDHDILDEHGILIMTWVGSRRVIKRILRKARLTVMGKSDEAVVVTIAN